MEFSVVPLLIADPSVPAEARLALVDAHTAPTPAARLEAKRRAAGVLVAQLGLSWPDVAELVELPPLDPRATCAGPGLA